MTAVSLLGRTLVRWLRPVSTIAPDQSSPLCQDQRKSSRRILVAGNSDDNNRVRRILAPLSRIEFLIIILPHFSRLDIIINLWFVNVKLDGLADTELAERLDEFVLNEERR